MSRFGRSYIRPVTRIRPQPNPIRQYTVNSADTASGTDALARAFRGTRASADTGVGVDSLTRSFIGTRNLADSSAATDVLTSVKRFPRSIADNALASDTMVRAFTGSRAIADAGLGLDTLTRRFIGARTASDYSTLVLSDSPTSYWNLSETTGLYADIVAGNNGTATGASFVRGATPLVAGGDGAWQGSTASYINLGDVLDFPSGAAFTLEAWVTFAVDGTASRAIMTKTGVDGGGQQGWLLVVTQATANLDLRMYRDGVLTLARGGNLVTGINHCVGTFDGLNLRVYINGTLVGGPTVAGTGLLNNTFNANIGAWTGGNNWTNKIDEVAVYSYALSAAQVQRHYNVGLNGGDTLAPTNDAVTRTAALLRNAADVAAGVDTVVRTFVGTRAPADTSSGIDAVARTFVGSRKPSDYKTMIVNTSGIQSYWRFSETTGAATVADSVGAVTGTYNNSQSAGLSLITGDSDRSLTPSSGASRYAYFGDVYNFSGTAAFTFEAWANPATFATFTRRLFSKRLTDGGGIEGYELTLNTAGFFSFARYLSNASLGVGSLAAAVTGTTYHIVATYDGTTTTLYINGASQGQTTDTRSILPSTGVNFTVGQFSGGGNGWDGTIDEFVVYNRALTATEVQRHYNVGLNGGDGLSPTTDTTARAYIGTRTASDTSAAIDTNARQFVGARTPTDTTSAVDSVTRRFIGSRTTPDGLNAIDVQNLVPNPNFEVNTTGWSTQTSNGGTTTLDTSWYYSGRLAFRINGTLAPGGYIWMFTSQGTSGMPITGGATYFARADMYNWSVGTSSQQQDLRIYWWDVSGTLLTTPTAQVRNGAAVTLGYLRYEGTLVAPVNARYAMIGAYMSGATGDFLDFSADNFVFGLNSPARAVVSSRTITDTSAAVDTNARQFIGSRAQTDAITGVDTNTRRFVGTRLSADNALGVDAVARSGRFSRTIPDTAAGVDSVTRHTVQARLIADIAAAVDTWARHFVGARTLADTASALDVLARSSGRFTRATSDSQGAIDSVARHAIQARLITDTAVANDTMARFFRGGRVFSDSAPASDAVIRSVINTRVVPDSAPTADVMSRSMGFFRRPINESAPANDTWTRRFVGTRSFVELAPAADTYIFSPHLVRRNVVLAHLTSTKTSLVEYNTIVQTTFDTLKSYISKEQMLVLSSDTQITATTASDGSTTLYQEIVTVPLYIDTN